MSTPTPDTPEEQEQPAETPTAFEAWIDTNEGQLALCRIFRTGLTHKRLKSLGEAFAAGQRSERYKLAEMLLQSGALSLSGLAKLATQLQK